MSTFKQVATIKFRAPLIAHGSWGHRDLGQHDSEMTLFVSYDRTMGFIEWDIESLDEFECIGLEFEDGALTDYDGIMALPKQAVDLLRANGFTVADEFV